MRNSIKHPLWISLFTLAAACGGAIDGDPGAEGTSESAFRFPSIPLNSADVICPASPPQISEQPYVGDTKTAAAIMHDSDVFWANAIFMTDQEEAAWINKGFETQQVPIWEIGARASALVQMYDLLAPIDSCRAAFYLERLRVIGHTLLANRDDKLHRPMDGSRNQVMAAWGGYTPDRDNRWNTDVVTAGLFTYPMAAFARRVAAKSAAFGAGYQQEAIDFTAAVIETYNSFRGELYLPDASNWAYFKLPTGYSTLACNDPDSKISHMCSNYRAGAGLAISWNENLSMMKALAEVAIAADSPLYRATPDSVAKQFTLYYATQEAPRLIAKNVAFFVQNLRSMKWSDGAPYYLWNHQYALKPLIQNTAHGGFELGSLAVVYEDQPLLDALLARNGSAERIGLYSSNLTRFATTLLRLIWKNNPSNSSQQNILAENVDGSGSTFSSQCGGFVALAQVDPWVWVRCRDTAFKTAGVNAETYAALLRYR